MQRYQISLDTSIRHTEDGTSTVVPSPIDIEKDEEQITKFKCLASSANDFPDGGLRAWLIVCGVRVLSLPVMRI